MHIHRSRHMRGFTTLPNYLLQDRRLSFNAKGVLVDLLSRPDGWREDGRQIADSSPQGRGSVSKALRELARFGYYRVEKLRRPDGTMISVAHVYDSPQLSVVPAAGKAGLGGAKRGASDGLSKNQGKNPSLPADPADDVADVVGGDSAVAEPAAAPATAAAAAAAREVPPEVREAAALLYRVLRPEPRLRLGAGEALTLAPLVAGWLELGASEGDLATALLPGLPQRIHAPAALLRDRLTRKRPAVLLAERADRPTVPARGGHECAQCAVPIPQRGICRSCAGLVAPPPAVSPGASVAARGAALARAALRRSTPVAVSIR
ncbi:helix-turn-helix domain-containing protein [Streptacidiphilus fuscans]|uniref:Helix-turn-helix domain-containing protein n=1 Tax=Streptacidiphilus fuscans TaxID=2789292 RepID=A0A931B2R9_9ACTN|nr:hypothetical protein [Streptacidiphilus fuscans]MBF9069191.1 hypothetical protein [Streptacidiphilus fuscans]